MIITYIAILFLTIVVLITNIMIHKLVIKSYKYKIKPYIYIFSMIPIFNILLPIISNIFESFYLILNDFKNVTNNYYDTYSQEYSFKRFSYGYCLCKNDFIANTRYMNYEEENMIKSICDFKIVRINGGYIFFCKTKKQIIENIEKINAYYVSKKLS